MSHPTKKLKVYDKDDGQSHSKVMEESCHDLLFKWCLDQGASMGPWMVNQQNSNIHTRAVYAKSFIPKNTQMCFIPSNILLSESVAMNSDIGKLIVDHVKTNQIHTILAHDKYPHALEMVCMVVFIVHEHFEVENSFWSPYLNSLPTIYNLPVCWPKDSIHQLLSGTALEFMTLERLKWIEEVVSIINTCVGHFFKNNSWNLENFLWAYASITSRAFPNATKKKSESDNSNNEMDWVTVSEICLYPMLDMLNHKRNHKIEWKMNDNGVSFVAHEDVQMGDEIFNNYGPKGNENLLGNYGFVLADNPEDYVKLKMNVHQNDPLYDQRFAILKNHSISQFVMLFIDDTNLSEKLLNLTQVMVANEYEIEQINRNGLEAFSSHRNRFQCLIMLYQLIESKLNENLKGKKKMLKFKERNYHFELAKVYREGQENILNHYLAMILKDLDTKFHLNEKSHGQYLVIGHPLNDSKFYTELMKMYDAIPDEMDEDTMLTLTMVHERFSKTSKWASQLQESAMRFTDTEVQKVLGNDIEEFDALYNELFEPLFLHYAKQLPSAKFNKSTISWATCLLQVAGTTVPSKLGPLTLSTSGENEVYGIVIG